MIKMYCIEKIITDLIYISGVSILTGALKGRKVLQDVMDRSMTPPIIVGFKTIFDVCPFVRCKKYVFTYLYITTRERGH